MNDSPVSSSLSLDPSALFGGDILTHYLLAEERLLRGQDVAQELSALIDTLEQRIDQLEQLARHDPNLQVPAALMKRVTFELLRHFAQKAELGAARAETGRLLGRTNLFEPLQHERFRITQDWFFANVPQWQRVFADRAGRPGLRALEIGSFEGMSACWLLEHVLTHAESRLICIDPFDSPGQPQAERNFDHNLSLTGQAFKATKLKGYSRQVLPLLDGSKFDIAYIDGSHHPIHALEDALGVWPLLVPGAIAIFDDYGIGASYPPELAAENDPRPGIDAFLRFVSGQYREVFRGYQLILEKL